MDIFRVLYFSVFIVTLLTTICAESKLCPNEGRISLEHPTSCSHFIYCEDGIESLMECIDGFQFDTYLGHCDDANKVRCKIEGIESLEEIATVNQNENIESGEESEQYIQPRQKRTNDENEDKNFGHGAKKWIDETLKENFEADDDEEYVKLDERRRYGVSDKKEESIDTIGQVDDEVVRSKEYKSFFGSEEDEEVADDGSIELEGYEETIDSERKHGIKHLESEEPEGEIREKVKRELDEGTEEQLEREREEESEEETEEESEEETEEESEEETEEESGEETEEESEEETEEESVEETEEESVEDTLEETEEEIEKETKDEIYNEKWKDADIEPEEEVDEKTGEEMEGEMDKKIKKETEEEPDEETEGDIDEETGEAIVKQQRDEVTHFTSNMIEKEEQGLAAALSKAMKRYIESDELCLSSRQHLLPHPYSCAQFIECDNGKYRVIDCLSGLHFNRKEGLCDFPNIAGCIDSTMVPTITDAHINKNKTDGPVGTCPVNNEKFPTYLADSNDCSIFYICGWNQVIEMKCGEGLHFNRFLNVCDWPEHAGCAVRQ